MSINPFSKNFEADYNLLLERVAVLESFMEENRRTAGQLFDRLGKGGDDSRQFILFCNIKSGDPTVQGQGFSPDRTQMVDPDQDLPESFYVVEPAIEFYRTLFGAGVNLPSADELLKKLEAPLWLRTEMEEGTFIGENACDYRYRPQPEAEGSVVQNLHGVNAPNEPEISGNAGVVNVKPLGNPTPTNGVGCVPVIFTKTRDDVHIGLYGKNDLGVSCAQASEEDAGLQARIRGARKRWLSKRNKNPENPETRRTPESPVDPETSDRTDYSGGGGQSGGY